jgi:predicted amino acid-binding ACT domain protein
MWRVIYVVGIEFLNIINIIFGFRGLKILRISEKVMHEYVSVVVLNEISLI